MFVGNPFVISLEATLTRDHTVTSNVAYIQSVELSDY